MSAFDWQFPYASYRKPILARNIVATSQPLAAQAGLRMLQQAERHGCGLATAIARRTGAGFERHRQRRLRIVWDGEKLHGFNASGRSPPPGRRSFSRATRPCPCAAGTR